MSVSERDSDYVRTNDRCGLVLDFETFLPIVDVLFAKSIDFMVWQPNIVSIQKEDGTPVSNVDRNAQTFVTNVLKKLAPHIPVCGEEDGQRRVSFGELPDTYWSVDPIDGTRFYEAMKDEWCVSIALVAGGEPCVGIILQPGKGEAYVAIKGRGIYMRTREITWRKFVRAAAVNPMLVVPTSLSVLRDPVLTQQAVRLTTHFKNTFSVPSALAVLEIVRGHAWGWASLFQPWCWDIAAACVLIGEIGGIALCADGTPIPLHTDRLPPVVFAVSYNKAEEIGLVLMAQSATASR